MKRKIIEIDEDLCTGCGNCVISCAEGALEIIDGKAKVVNDVFCDGLGACIGDCPEDALKIIERDAPDFDEKAVEEHLEKLKLNEESEQKSCQEPGNVPCGCPGSRTMSFETCDDGKEQTIKGKINSQLKNWPIQLHLASPTAPYFQGADILLSADCVAFSLGGFHPKYLKGKVLSIACPKLDQGQESYIKKITSLVDDSKINTLTVMTMEVPCCSGLIRLVKEGIAQAKRKVPIKSIIVSLQGEILGEEWL
ncbi:MAG: 4Fe-4S dicluster domain-containing protein [Candidatus Lokiarchaeota archaeon]|nr:4Fe-4S dicluster domain-containing protein [Candidatus Lokiarchaeota archaeon]